LKTEKKGDPSMILINRRVPFLREPQLPKLTQVESEG